MSSAKSLAKATSMLLLSVVICTACSASSDGEQGRGPQGAPKGAEDSAGDSVSSGGVAAPGGAPTAASGGEPLVLTGGASSGGDTAGCGSVEVQVSRPVPTVWLLVDGSGSMAEPFTAFGDARWNVLREALLNPSSGLVALAQEQVAFGLAVYDGGISPPGIYLEGVCPRLVIVEPALRNLAAIDAAYPPLPLGASTPTHYALEEVSKLIDKTPTIDGGPVALVLATDGHPNICDFHDGIPTNPILQDEAVNTVGNLASRGTKTYVIALSEGDPTLKVHLDAVAQAGGGASGEAFSPTSPADLAVSLTSIVGDAIGCEFAIDGKIAAGKGCEGAVLLNGAPLACESPDGYSVDSGGQTLMVSGDACEALRSAQSATLTASFPCEAVELY